MTPTRVDLCRIHYRLFRLCGRSRVRAAVAGLGQLFGRRRRTGWHPSPLSPGWVRRYGPRRAGMDAWEDHWR